MTDWEALFAKVAEQNRLIIAGICPLCGGQWGEEPEGHKDDCPGARPATGVGKGWRQGRGREKCSTRRQRMMPLDVIIERARE